jgi:hypothetical protein
MNTTESINKDVMGYKWDINGIKMVYKWDINAIYYLWM